MSDGRRIDELSELLFDGELDAAEARELRAHLEATPAAVAVLLAAARDHLLCRTALRPADPALLTARTRLMLDSWRPSSRQVAAQSVLARVDRRRRWAALRTWGGLAAAALVLALLMPSALAFLRRPALAADARAPQLTDVRGDLRLDSGFVLAAGDRLGIGATMTSGADGTATLVWSDGTRVALAGGTTIGRLPGTGQRLRLDHGTVTVRAAHRPADEPLEIICPDAIARVVGTAFSATVVDGRSKLTVVDGLVRWQRAADGAWSLLGAGQQATAAALPLPRGLLLPADRIAALREAITAGREPWAGSWKALKERVPSWLIQKIPAPFVQEVSAYHPGNEQHTAARRTLYRLVQPALGLALAARLTGDEACGRRAIAWMRVIAQVGIHGADAGTVGSDTLAVHGLQTADLLRGLPYWTAADEAAVDTWIERELTSRAQLMRDSWSVTSRWRGIAALMFFAARRGDQPAVRALMAEVRGDMPTMLSRAAVRRMNEEPDKHTLHQALNHGLLCADLARIAAGDATPPPAVWGEAIALLAAEVAGGSNANGEARFFLRALDGPGPWRVTVPRAALAGPDQPRFGYGWLFPTLIAQDPRWP